MYKKPSMLATFIVTGLAIAACSPFVDAAEYEVKVDTDAFMCSMGVLPNTHWDRHHVISESPLLYDAGTIIYVTENDGLRTESGKEVIIIGETDDAIMTYETPCTMVIVTL